VSSRHFCSRSTSFPSALEVFHDYALYKFTIDIDIDIDIDIMVAKENKPPKPLKIKSVPGLDIGPDELKEKQKTDPTLKK